MDGSVNGPVEMRLSVIWTWEVSLRWTPSVLGLSAGAITRRKLAFTPVHRVKVRWNCCPFCSVTPCTLTPRHASKCTACVQKKKGRTKRSGAAGDHPLAAGVEQVRRRLRTVRELSIHLWTRPRVARLHTERTKTRGSENSGDFIISAEKAKSPERFGGWWLKPAGRSVITGVFLRLQVLAHHCCPEPSMVPPPLTDRPSTP